MVKLKIIGELNNKDLEILVKAFRKVELLNRRRVLLLVLESPNLSIEQSKSLILQIYNDILEREKAKVLSGSIVRPKKRKGEGEAGNTPRKPFHGGK